MRTHAQPDTEKYPSITQLTWPGKLLHVSAGCHQESQVDLVAIELSHDRIATVCGFRSEQYSLWVRNRPSMADHQNRAWWLGITSKSGPNTIHKTYILGSPLELLATAHHVYQQEQERISC